MAIQLGIAGWEARGLRCPDHTVALTDANDRVCSVSLLQMPNGTGKTTTLQLLRAALSGSITEDQWDAKKVLSFRKREGASSEGSFKVAILNNTRRITFAINFNFEEGTVAYTTTLPSGMKRGFHPPRELERFLKPDFVNLYVFDGELAEQLLSRDHTNAQTAIEDLFQLRIIAHLTARVRDYWDQAMNGKSARQPKGLARRRNKVKILRERIKKLKKERDKATEAFQRAKRRLSEKRKRFQASIEKREAYRERLDAAHSALTEAEHHVEMLCKEVLSKMRSPHALSEAFAESVVELKQSLDRVKLPETAAREFFEELAGEDCCVCGRPLDDVTRQAIRSRASSYFGSDDVALLNSLKSDIADHVGAKPEAHESELNGLIGKLKVATSEAEECRTERDAIQEEAVSGDPELENAQEEIRELEAQVRSFEHELQAYDDANDTANDEHTTGIRVLEHRLEDAEKKLAEITETLELKSKSDTLTLILESAQALARQRLSTQICAEANKRVVALMPDSAVRIEKIDQCLVLRGQEGGSAGETLSIAYAFLATLFNRAEHQLPFIVDSPAGPLDLRVRAEVARLIPQLAEQFIAFTISSERDSFLVPLEKAAAKRKVQHITLFRKGPTDLESAARKCSQVEETADGICVYDREFFCKFHLDSED